jgi:exonuclease SbcC
MRPLKLRIAGLRSYHAERTVDFSDLSLVAIIGTTGAGKSSLLEGITYALYGASTWDRRAVKELISDAAVTMRISLEFDADGETWQVTRMISRKAGGSHELICLSDPDVAKVDGAGAVSSRIEDLIGLDYEGFCACVLLPQGKFEQLLKANKKDRASILKGILRLDELDMVRARATEFAQRLTPRCDEIQAARAQFLPDPAGTHQQAAARQKELQPRRQELEKAKSAVDILVADAEDRRRRASEAEVAAGRVAELVDQKLIQRMQILGELESELTNEHRSAVQIADQAEADSTNAEQVVADLRASRSDTGSVKNAGMALKLAREDLSAIAREQRELTDAQRQFEADRETQATQTAELNGLAAAVAKHEDAVKSRQASAAVAAQTCEALVAQVTAIVDARLALQSARQDHKQARDVHAERVVDRDTANVSFKQAQRAAADARGALVQAQREGIAAELAHDCRGGDPCPICARTLPESFVAPTFTDHRNAVQDALARAEADERTAGGSASAADGSVSVAEGLLANAVKLLTDSTAAWEAQRAVGLPDGLEAETVELDETTIGQLRAPEQEAKLQLDACGRELEGARDAHTRLQAICAAAQSEHERRATALKTAAETLSERRTTVRERLDELPSWVGLEDEPSDSAFETAVARIATRLGEAEQAEHAAASAKEMLVTAHEATHAIDTRLREDVRDPARDERTALLNLRGELARIKVQVPPAPEESAPISEATEWASAVLDAGTCELERLRALAQSENKTAKSKTDESRATVTELGFAGVRNLEEALIGIRAEEITAQRDLEQAAAQLQPTAQLDALLAESQALRNGLNELARQLADAKFVGFVVERRQRALLTSASGILARVTAGQFGFTEDFQIIDRRSDMARSADTLSGGETFLASLALALGLVELAGRSGGRLQALFLDEGFGTLDPDALDQALSELEQRAHGGRLIALISHVPAVAERIDQILQVTKTPQGSDVHLLSESERNALLLDDATETAIVAQ